MSELLLLLRQPHLARDGASVLGDDRRVTCCVAVASVECRDERAGKRQIGTLKPLVDGGEIASELPLGLVHGKEALRRDGWEQEEDTLHGEIST